MSRPLPHNKLRLLSGVLQQGENSFGPRPNMLFRDELSPVAPPTG